MRYGGAESIGSTGDNHHLSGVRSLQNGDDADRHLSVVLRLQLLRGCVEAPTRRLLRVLFLRDRALSAGASRYCRAIDTGSPSCEAAQEHHSAALTDESLPTSAIAFAL